MEKLAKIWAECGYDKETIVQRIQAIMKYNEVCILVEIVWRKYKNVMSASMVSG